MSTATASYPPVAPPPAPREAHVDWPSIPLLFAAVLSAGAGLVHATAAGTHTGDDSLVWLFTLCAVAQVGWAAVAAIAPRRPSVTAWVAIAGALINGATAAAWVFSRTVGLPLVASLSEVEAVGTQDLCAALLGTAATVAALAAIWWRPRIPVGAFAPLAVIVVIPAMIGMVAPHEHGGSHDDHGTEVAAEDHTTATGEHTHAAAGDVDAIFSGADVTGIPADQLASAKTLIEDTRAAVTAAGFTDEASAVAAGYAWIGDGRRPTGVVYRHYINSAYIADGVELDPNRIESLVFEVTDGVPKLAMYIATFGSTMADVPDIAGSLTTWHDHQNLCWDESGTRLAGVVRNGQCKPAGTLRATPPMLHVWLQDNQCGPFAGVEGHATAAQKDSAAHVHAN